MLKLSKTSKQEVIPISKQRAPEETRKKILDVAQQLFLKKGYDDTSIQDIIDGLGGLTKGVIYHHFKSKLDIFDNVSARLASEEEGKDWHEGWKGTSGFDKIQTFFLQSVRAHERQAMAFNSKVLMKSPRMIGLNYLDNFNQVVPALKKYIEEGIEDGSIVTEYPEELAELIILTTNMWMGMQMHNYTWEQLERRILFVKKVYEGINFPVINDEILEGTLELYEYLQKKK